MFGNDVVEGEACGFCLGALMIEGLICGRNTSIEECRHSDTRMSVEVTSVDKRVRKAKSTPTDAR